MLPERSLHVTFVDRKPYKVLNLEGSDRFLSKFIMRQVEGEYLRGDLDDVSHISSAMELFTDSTRALVAGILEVAEAN